LPSDATITTTTTTAAPSSDKLKQQPSADSSTTTITTVNGHQANQNEGGGKMLQERQPTGFGARPRLSWSHKARKLSNNNNNKGQQLQPMDGANGSALKTENKENLATGNLVVLEIICLYLLGNQFILFSTGLH